MLLLERSVALLDAEHQQLAPGGKSLADEAQPEPREGGLAQPRSVAAASRGRVLVVDDEGQIRSFIRDVLLDEGFAVDVAATGAAAIGQAVAARPDVVVLDMMLPDLSGEAVADALRSKLGEVRILVITADPLAPDRAQRSGAYGYLRKPFDLDDLVDQVRRGFEA